MKLKEEEINRFEDQMKTEKIKIQQVIEKYKKELNFGDDVESEESYEEEADEAEEFANYTSVKHEMKKRLNNIDLALAKIKEEKYGFCEKCQSDLDTELLEAEPESRLCRECKKGSAQ